MPAPSRRPRRRTARTSIVVHCKAYPFRFSWEQPTGRTGAPARHLKVAPNVCRRAPPPAPVRVWSGQAKTGLLLVRSRGRAASPLAAGIWVAQWDAAGRADALRPESGQTMHPRISAPSFGIPFSGGQGLPALPSCGGKRGQIRMPVRQGRSLGEGACCAKHGGNGGPETRSDLEWGVCWRSLRARKRRTTA